MNAMNGDEFSLKARRTTRIPLRIPVQVVVQEEGKPRTLDAWTTIVNIHGARIECKRGLDLNQEVLIQVPFNGMSERGCVVWNRKEQNDRGNFEFAVELARPENLWGVGFPPSDWDSVKGTANGNGSAPKVTEPAAAAPRANPNPPFSSAPAPEEPPAAAAVAATGDIVPQLDIGQSDPSMVDLSAELNFSSGETFRPSVPESSEPPAPAPTFEESIEMLITTQLESPAPAPPLAAEPLRPEPLREEANLSAGNQTDRLAAFFHELVETALRDRVMGVVQRISERMESRVQQIEADAISRVEQRIQFAADSQGERMERRASDFSGSQQVALEQSVQQFLASSESAARQRQQEFLDQSQQALRGEMTALLESSKSRLEQQAADLASVTQQALRFSMQQELPAIQKDLLERCAVEAERQMAGQVEQWTLLLKDRAQEMRQSVVAQMEETSAETGKRQSAAMEEAAEQCLQQALSRQEQQLARIGTQVRQSFLRHIVGELSRSQQICIQQAQSQMETVAAQNLQWTQQSVSKIMNNFGESLIRQAYLEGGTPTEITAVPNASKSPAEQQAATSFPDSTEQASGQVDEQTSGENLPESISNHS